MSHDDSVQASRFEGLSRRFASAWQSRVPALLGTMGMSEFRAMVAVQAQNQAAMSDIARALGLTLGATTSVVDRLVRAGFVLREHDSQDRRVVRIKLTPAGRAKASETLSRMTSDMAGLLEKLAEDERARFLDAFEAIVAQAERAS